MVIAVLLVVLAGALLAVVGGLSAQDRLPRNQWIGLRTRRIGMDDETWRAGHRAAAPWLLASAAASFATAVVAFVYADRSWSNRADALMIGLMLACLVVGMTQGDAAAKRVLRAKDADAPGSRSGRQA